jgi:hypothetical protein
MKEIVMRKLFATMGMTAALVAAFAAGFVLRGAPAQATKTIMSSTPVVLVPDQGPSRSLALVHVNSSSVQDFPGWVEVQIFDENGVYRATPIRFKMSNSGQRIAADFPGCDPGYVITDSGGHITNG